jgi:uncharacterized radical SAM superfamily Fe-S cluster-containing enzyme
MPEEEYAFTPTSKLMQVDEIESIAKIFVSQGVKKIRLTGGEPLVRKDAAEIIMRLSKLPIKLTPLFFTSNMASQNRRLVIRWATKTFVIPLSAVCIASITLLSVSLSSALVASSKIINSAFL